ncbi:MAG: CBS domain-containing protein [Anaerolineaceae bacterium]|nr:CBS domain-containing protein [Anaerolineaceae bacterium]
MKKNVFSIPATATVQDAIDLLVSHHIGLLPVLDLEKRPVGVIGLYDMIHLALPSAIHLLDDIDFIGDFGALETYQPSEAILTQPITKLMRPGTVVRADSGLIRAYAIMLQYDLHDLPVVDGAGRLIGIASRVDIGTTILANWQSRKS